MMRCPQCQSTNTSKVSVFSAWRTGQECCNVCSYQAEGTAFEDPPWTSEDYPNPLKRWSYLLERLNFNEFYAGIHTFFGLIERYSEPHRYYHTMSHIQMCLTEFDRIKHLVQDPDAVEFALWYHDAVYNTRSQTNESESAELAVEMLQKLGVLLRRQALVRSLILETKHANSPETLEAQVMIDVDLSILGQPSAVFAQYDLQIRQEYSWVPEDYYKEKRIEVLQGFLDRPFIYSTTEFRELYEQSARNNLKEALERLRTGVLSC